MVVGDNRFEAVREALIPVHIKIVASDEHEVCVESLICTVKERKRCDFHHIPYNNFPKLVVVSSLEAKRIWMNVFQKNNLISKTPRPSAILLGTPEIDSTHNTL